MGMAESVAARKVELLSAQDAAVQAFGEGCFSDGVASVPPVIGADPDEQAKIDAAVAQAVGPLNDQISALTAKDAADIQAGLDAVAAIQLKLDDMGNQLKAAQDAKSAEDAVVLGLQGQVSQIRDLADKLAALVIPQPPQP